MKIAAKPAMATLLLWLLLFLPSAAMMLFGAGSMLPGLILSSAIICWAFLRARKHIRLSGKSRRVQVALAISLFLVIHGGFVTLLGGAVDWARLAGSLLAIGLVFFAATEIGCLLKSLSDTTLNHVLACTFWVLVALGIVSIVAPPIFAPITHSHPVVFFIEPSHYSLVLVPFAGYAIIRAQGLFRWSLVLAILAFGLMLKSTTLLVGIAIILIGALPVRQFISVVAMCFLAAAVTDFDVDFLLSRVMLSADSDNLSNLVLVQGWERAGLSLVETRGIGLGFQQFGVWGPHGEIQDVIYGLAGDYVNYFDGGSSASKIVAELGVLGIILLGVFVRLWYVSSLQIKVALRKGDMPAWDVFLCLVPSAVAVELFIRGVGYLSFGLVLICLLFAGPIRDSRRREVSPGLCLSLGRG